MAPANDFGEPASTAQGAFKHLMRDLIGPRLRELGFSGSYMRAFWISYGDKTAYLSTQKNRYSTTQEVEFWVHLYAIHEPTDDVYWSRQLSWLLPGLSPRHWTVTAGAPTEPVAQSVLDSFRRYGWPAMQAAMETPIVPPDGPGQWPRTFPGGEDGRWEDRPPDLGPITWVLQPAGRPADQLFASLADDRVASRRRVLEDIAEEGADDPRTLPVLLDRLEHDPSSPVRERVAKLLAQDAGDETVRQSLQDAADQDEDVQVRWAARYALRHDNTSASPP